MAKIEIKFLDIDKDQEKPVCRLESCEYVELHAPHKPTRKRRRKRDIERSKHLSIVLA